MSKRKRFLPLKNYKGIRKDTQTGKYVARKYIDNKEYSETFDRISDADRWRRNFHPLLTNAEIQGVTTKGLDLHQEVKVHARANGVDGRFTFKEVWELYQKLYFPLLEMQSKDTIMKYAKNFFPELMNLKMQEINAEVLDAFMEIKVAEAKRIGNTRRHSFRNDLKCLKALLNWYRENYDGMFVVPVLKRHFALGIIKKVPKRNSKKMTVEQMQLFLDSFKSLFWRDFATIHFFMAGRAQEVGGLQWSCVDFERKLIQVEDVCVWGEKKSFTYLKEIPKNGEQRVVCLNEQMLNILFRRKTNKSKIPCEFFRESTGERLDFVFEIEGQPVSYRSIQHHYNMALKRAGLFPEFSSTHIMRKAMANIVRQELGLDAAQAAGGWKSRSIVEKTYTDAPNQLNKVAVEHVGKLVSSNQKKRLQLVQNG